MILKKIYFLNQNDIPDGPWKKCYLKKNNNIFRSVGLWQIFSWKSKLRRPMKKYSIKIHGCFSGGFFMLFFFFINLLFKIKWSLFLNRRLCYHKKYYSKSLTNHDYESGMPWKKIFKKTLQKCGPWRHSRNNILQKIHDYGCGGRSQNVSIKTQRSQLRWPLAAFWKKYPRQKSRPLLRLNLEIFFFKKIHQYSSSSPWKIFCRISSVLAK